MKALLKYLGLALTISAISVLGAFFGGLMTGGDGGAASVSAQEGDRSDWDKNILLNALQPEVSKIRDNRGIRIKWRTITDTAVLPTHANEGLPSRYIIERTSPWRDRGLIHVRHNPQTKYQRARDMTTIPGESHSYTLYVVYHNGIVETFALEPAVRMGAQMPLDQSVRRLKNGSNVVKWKPALWKPFGYEVSRLTLMPNGNYGEEETLGQVRHKWDKYLRFVDTTANPDKQYSYKLTALKRYPNGLVGYTTGTSSAGIEPQE